MKYFLVHFKREVPQIEGMKLVIGIETHIIISLTPEGEAIFPFDDYKWTELTEAEATTGVLFYGCVKTYRKAYADDGGAEAGAKVKVNMTAAKAKVAISLMRKLTTCMVEDVFHERDEEVDQALLDEIQACKNMRELNLFRENKLGLEMPSHQAEELGLVDVQGNRKEKFNYGPRF